MSSIKCHSGDITKLKVDAIVNAANSSLLGGGGVDGCIHRAAGPQLLEECRTLHGCRTGEAKITGGYNLPAKHVIHTVGPIYSGSSSDPEMLRNCYWNSLEVAKAGNLHSIAFPGISTGVYGYPKKEAAYIALTTVKEWIEANSEYDVEVTFVCFSEEDYRLYETIIRVSDMEEILDKAREIMDKAREDQEEFLRFQPRIKRLAAYYESRFWKDDFALDEAGALPKELKRGVLSEDGIYNALELNKELLEITGV